MFSRSDLPIAELCSDREESNRRSMVRTNRFADSSLIRNEQCTWSLSKPKERLEKEKQKSTFEQGLASTTQNIFIGSKLNFLQFGIDFSSFSQKILDSVDFCPRTREIDSRFQIAITEWSFCWIFIRWKLFGGNKTAALTPTGENVPTYLIFVSFCSQQTEKIKSFTENEPMWNAAVYIVH